MMIILYRHPVKDNFSMTKSTLHKSIHAFVFQVLRQISLLYHDATLRMYTGDFKELTAISVAL